MIGELEILEVGYGRNRAFDSHEAELLRPEVAQPEL